MPNTAVGQEFTWVLAALNGARITEGDVTARFTATFLSQVPASQVVEIVGELQAGSAWTLLRFEPTSSTLSLSAVVTRGDGQYWRIFIALDAAQKIGGLLLTSAGELDPALQSWAAVEQALADGTAGQLNMMAASIDGDGCTPMSGVATETSLAIGSTFKLWILAALAKDIAAGNHLWVDAIAIDDEHKSLPSGVLQDEPAGTLLSLRDFASRMISISDNTAADHLLFFLGRGAVEAILPLTGHHQPTQNQPFLGTREMFNLKLMVTSAEQQAYLDADVQGRRTLLAQYDATYDPRLYMGPPWILPRLIDKLEWFATPGDLCNTMRALRDAGDDPATQPVLDILAENQGIADLSGAFSYIGFKGGSEPGVLNLTWLLRRKVDQKWLFLTLGFNDAAAEVDVDRALYVASAARALLAKP